VSHKHKRDKEPLGISDLNWDKGNKGKKQIGCRGPFRATKERKAKNKGEKNLLGEGTPYTKQPLHSGVWRGVEKKRRGENHERRTRPVKHRDEGGKKRRACKKKRQTPQTVGAKNGLRKEEVTKAGSGVVAQKRGGERRKQIALSW